MIFEGPEITNNDGTPYTVFTPYTKRWKMKLQSQNLPSFSSAAVSFTPHIPLPLPSLKDLGFNSTDLRETALDLNIVRNYAQTRNLPGIQGTTRIGMALRFGNFSIRECVRIALEESADTWLNELIWCEFFKQILYHFPHVINQSFRPQYDRIPWRNNEAEFERWCNGTTGYPLVDAGMRELNATGFIHNRA